MILREQVLHGPGRQATSAAPTLAGHIAHAQECVRKLKPAGSSVSWERIRRLTGTALFVLAVIDPVSGFPAFPPPIESITPTQNALQIACTAAVVISFSEDMDPSTISSATLVISSSLAGNVPGSYNYDVPSRSVNFNPHSPFTAGDVISVTATKKMLTAQGDSVAYPMVWSFTVESKGGQYGILTATSVMMGNQIKDIACGDIDSNGLPDFAVARFDVEDVSFASSTGCPGYVLQPPPLTGFNDPFAVIVGDFNGDGWVDLATSNSATGGVPMEHLVSVAVNTQGTFGGTVEFNAGLAPRLLSAGDVDGDGDQDLVASNPDGYTASLINDGAGSFASKPFAGGPDDPFTLRLADMDNDGDLDAIISGSAISIRANEGSGMFSVLGDFESGTLPRFLAVGDIDRDGFVDVVAARTASGELLPLLNDGGGMLNGTALTPVAMTGTITGVVLADYDGDGDLDAAIAVNNPNSVSILLNDGTGNFSPSTSIPLADGPVVIRSADLNRDGSAGLAIATEGGQLVILGRNTCPFQGDLNGDGFIDAADLAVEIDIVYFGAPDTWDYECPASRSDFDVNGAPDAVDVAYLIDHVFFGGEGPIDPCGN